MAITTSLTTAYGGGAGRTKSWLIAFGTHDDAYATITHGFASTPLVTIVLAAAPGGVNQHNETYLAAVNATTFTVGKGAGTWTAPITVLARATDMSLIR